MPERDWSFESLAGADAQTLEALLRRAAAPDPDQLVGHIYRGYNHRSSPLARRAAIKFRKAFFWQGSTLYGVNEMVAQDGDDASGNWQVMLQIGSPAEHGFYRVEPVSKSQPFDVYGHLLALNYHIDTNPKRNVLARMIYDVIGLPTEDDYSLILGKAYLRPLQAVSIFAGYFVLGHPESYTR